MHDLFSTIIASSRSEYREKASRFFGFADPVADEEAATEIRERLKKEYHDARHRPYALRLANCVERCADDGEPRGTAGHPILQQIRQANLYDIQIVVVRYFGGTLLGKGGLSRAFSECARLALENAERKEIQVTKFLDLIAPTDQAGVVKAVASRFGGTVAAISFDTQARIRLSVPGSQFNVCREALRERFGPDIFSGES
jgi:uncharacterized YigZ family protein